MPLHLLHRSLARTTHPRMMEDDEEEVGGGFGVQSLYRTSLFVTLWWALWSLYDFYLSPFSPWPEFAILAAAFGISLREDARQESEQKSADASGELTPWPCTTEGCMAEDLPFSGLVVKPDVPTFVEGGDRGDDENDDEIVASLGRATETPGTDVHGTADSVATAVGTKAVQVEETAEAEVDETTAMATLISEARAAALAAESRVASAMRLVKLRREGQATVEQRAAIASQSERVQARLKSIGARAAVVPAAAANELNEVALAEVEE